MSYPRCLQTLIIEDEHQMIGVYQEHFRELAREPNDLRRPLMTQGGAIAPPVIVGGIQDALDQINSERYFHLVVLDLKLPVAAGGDAEDGVSKGLDLLGPLASREHCPVPVLLVVTGDPRRLQRLEHIEEFLRNGFWHAAVHTKGVDLAQHLEAGILKCWEYCDFGAQVSDPLQRAWPPLTPREEDLLRRGGLFKGTAVGVHLKWWSAEKWADGNDESPADWSKVLHGHYVMKGEDGHSRPRFFKIEAEGKGSNSHHTAIRLAEKLHHVRVEGYEHGGNRSILITDKAGPSDEDPISLDAFVRRASSEVSGHLGSIARDVAGQLRQLAQLRKEAVSLSSLLWKYTRTDTLERAWEKVTPTNERGSVISPGRLFSALADRHDEFGCDYRVRQSPPQDEPAKM